MAVMPWFHLLGLTLLLSSAASLSLLRQGSHALSLSAWRTSLWTAGQQHHRHHHCRPRSSARRRCQENHRRKVLVCRAGNYQLQLQRRNVHGNDKDDDSPGDDHNHSNNNSSSLDNILTLLDECWNATSWNIPVGLFMKPVLDGLVSPAPQTLFALQRALDMDYIKAARLCQFLLKPGRSLIVKMERTASSSSSDSGTTTTQHHSLSPDGDWTIIKDDEEACPHGWIRMLPPLPPSSQTVKRDATSLPTAHQLAVMILDEAMAAAAVAGNHSRPHDFTIAAVLNERQMRLWHELKDRLNWTLGTELRGRKAADTALTLALAGVVDEELYGMLYHIIFLELERKRERKRGVKDMLHTIEKAAASGAPPDHPLFESARACLQYHRDSVDPDILVRIRGNMSLLDDDRPPLWLWRFASRLPRPVVDRVGDVGSKQQQGLAHAFARPDLPLIVDLGCGFGLTLLGLAGRPLTAVDEKGNGSLFTTTTGYNLLGCDANPLNVNYANGIAKRWGMEERLQYVCTTTGALLSTLVAEQVPVRLVLLQFPTPYRLQETGEGNSQLPRGSDDDSTFMASKAIIDQIAQLHAGALLLLQSNCEDVAVQMFAWASAAGLVPVPAVHPVQEPSPFSTERTQRWLQQLLINNNNNDDAASHRGPARAVGPYWSAQPWLPTARSETEIACTIQNIPVHRCLFRVV